MTHHLQETFLQGNNTAYLVALYQRYCADPESVTKDWRHYFDSLGSEAAALFVDDRPPQWIKRHHNDIHVRPAETARPHHHARESVSHHQEKHAQPHHQAPTEPAPQKVFEQPTLSAEITAPSHHQIRQATSDSTRALMLIRAYKVRGHLHANLDPLGLEKRPLHAELLPETYGFTADDWDRQIFIDKNLAGLEFATLREIMDLLNEIYCGTVGMEFMHIQDPDQKKWIQDRIESLKAAHRVPAEERLHILQNLIDGDSFEHFLHVRYPGVKRFGLEGGESLIPGLEALVHQAGAHGVEEIVFGMAHRGRLGVLANIIHKPLDAIFSHFQAGKIDPESVFGSGDVKYHIGYSAKRMIHGRDMQLTLEPNPSHLEAVNPVVLGTVRAKQKTQGDAKGHRIMGVLMHGDAAFAGQGLVAETLELCDLDGFSVGGTIHIIINNQIGFTTSPPHSRSSPYSSDIAKAIQAPIIHVNGDDPEAVVWAMRFAMDYRRDFQHDVVVDMVCYRRHGHNEIDEPGFTQPIMYRAIGAHPSTLDLYKNKLIQSQVISAEKAENMMQIYAQKLQHAYEHLEKSPKSEGKSWTQWLDDQWQNIKGSRHQPHETSFPTGIDAEALKKIGHASIHIPPDFNLHPRIARQFKAKQEMFESGEKIDWATAESLAFGSLLLEDIEVRLSGQDCGRGTFSQRHIVWVDQETEKKHIAINHITKTQKHIQVIDSPLAEASVLGFEYGYSVMHPNALVMWEAQFGDFSNGAQVIIDQFISSGEHKWQRNCGLVMLLPHGFEGQGPEHSSSRLERYLQLCGENNMSVVNCSTPANYFHVLRRQLYSDNRKPLIVITPKTLLRHKLAVSTLADMGEDTCFMTVLGDPVIKAANTRRVILCSGKIYYELLQKRNELNREDIAIIRLEQYYPFPHQRLADVLAPYRHADFFWCQEEPMNMGAWSFVDRRLEQVLHEIGAPEKSVHYIGRPEAASPATGVHERHEVEQSYIVNHALTGMEQTITKGLFAI